MEITIKGSLKEIAELLAGLRTEAKKSAPHSTAEQNTDVHYLHATSDDIKEATQSISEYRSLIASIRS